MTVRGKRNGEHVPTDADILAVYPTCKRAANDIVATYGGMWEVLDVTQRDLALLTAYEVCRMRRPQRDAWKIARRLFLDEARSQQKTRSAPMQALGFSNRSLMEVAVGGVSSDNTAEGVLRPPVEWTTPLDESVKKEALAFAQRWINDMQNRELREMLVDYLYMGKGVTRIAEERHRTPILVSGEINFALMQLRQDYFGAVFPQLERFFPDVYRISKTIMHQEMRGAQGGMVERNGGGE